MIVFEHYRCPLHRYTFSVRPIRNWVEAQCDGKVLNLFAGITRLTVDEVRNDLNATMDAAYRMDAVDFLRSWNGPLFDTILLDPPYAYRKSMELYNGYVCSSFRQLKDNLRACLNPHGKVITFGYHSVVMGTTRGFAVERIALFSHGGATHDTIATVERSLL